MITVVAFLCALAVSPSECSRTTAVDVIALPASPSELACMQDAQMTLAELAIRADADHRWIVKCSRSNVGLGTVG